MNTTLELVRVDPKSIIVSDRLRFLDEDIVESICADGLRDDLHPIIVRPIFKNKELRPSGLRLVTGDHRLAAALRLGAEKIAAIKKRFDDDQARLVEIDEILLRRELNPLDRAVFLAERKKVYLELYPETRHGGDRKSVDFKGKNQTDKMSVWSFGKNTARHIGITERSIRRSIHVAENIPADVRKRLSGTKIAEKQTDLLYLASIDPSTQRKALTFFFEGEAKTLKQAVAKVEGTEEPEPTRADRQLSRLLDLWARSNKSVKSQFLAHLRLIGELAP